MKKIYYLLLLLPALFVAACSPQQDEVFDQSSSQRIQNSLNSLQTILTGAKNGWLFQYFPGNEQQFGGFNMVIKFATDGSVTVYNPIVKNGAGITSLYTLKQYGGPVLSFDTYNEAMHYFSDPVNPDNLGEGLGKGLLGDFEFAAMSATAEKVVLRGVKKLGISVLTPLAADANIANTLNAMEVMQKNISAPIYEMYFNGNKINSLTFKSNVFTASVTTNNVSTDYTIPVIATSTGIQFYQAISFDTSVKEPNMQHFTYDASKDRFVCSDEGVNAYIQKAYPPINAAFANTQTQWLFNIDFSSATPTIKDMSPSIAALFTAANAAEASNYGGYLKMAYLGRNYVNQSNPTADKNIWSFNFYSAEGSDTWQSLFGYTPVAVTNTEDQVKFTSITSGLNGSYYMWYYTNIVKFIVSKTWQLIPNDAKKPTIIKFVDTSDSTNWFQVSSE